MKRKKTYRSFYNDQYKGFRQVYKDVEDGYGMDPIHQARVHLKRTRLLFDWLEHLYPKTFCSEEAFGDLERVFKSMGEIRDLQVMRKGFKVYENRLGKDFSYLLDKLKKEEKKEKKQFGKKARKFRTGKKGFQRARVSKLLEEKSERSFRKASDKFISPRREAILSLPKAAKKDVERVHDIRTLTKELMFFLELHDLNHMSQWPDAEVAEVRELGELLGNWHDLAVRADFLRDFIEDEAGEKGKKVKKALPKMKRLLGFIEQERDEALEKVLAYQASHFRTGPTVSKKRKKPKLVTS